jgi:phenylacetate-coenzyme A ligase PaaK-like adenylate-forming protein
MAGIRHMSYLEILKHIIALRREQWLPPGEILSMQEAKLSRILSLASKTRHYNGLDLSSDPLEALGSLPLTTKKEIQEDIPAFLTE